MSPNIVEGSFRDRSGRVVEWQGRVFRTLSKAAFDLMSNAHETGMIERMTNKARLWPSELLPEANTPPELMNMSESNRLLEHPVLPFISYPYEWPFSLLKEAAITHLDLHLAALEEGYNLVDGSAYNIQFNGVKPVFIDTLSLVKYEDGDYWNGYRQFCEQFLGPLLLSTKLGMSYHSWYRGELEGIPIGELSKIMGLRQYFSPAAVFHIILHAHLQQKHSDSQQSVSKSKNRFPKSRLKNLLLSLRNTINSMTLKGVKGTEWGEYEKNNSYTSDENQKKQDLISTFVGETKAEVVWDLGCNSGLFSEAALIGGAKHVVGFDVDFGALEVAVSRAKTKKLNFTPLHFNAMNPSPNQGWRQSERLGLTERANADVVMALAFIHHLVIGRNAPLDEVISWLMSIAPKGIIEFIPKTDPMIVRMLATREDIFADYAIETMIRSIESKARIVKREVVSASGRELFFYETDTDI